MSFVTCFCWSRSNVCVWRGGGGVAGVPTGILTPPLLHRPCQIWRCKSMRIPHRLKIVVLPWRGKLAPQKHQMGSEQRLLEAEDEIVGRQFLTNELQSRTAFDQRATNGACTQLLFLPIHMKSLPMTPVGTASSNGPAQPSQWHLPHAPYAGVIQMLTHGIVAVRNRPLFTYMPSF